MFGIGETFFFAETGLRPDLWLNTVKVECMGVLLQILLVPVFFLVSFWDSTSWVCMQFFSWSDTSFSDRSVTQILDRTIRYPFLELWCPSFKGLLTIYLRYRVNHCNRWVWNLKCVFQQVQWLLIILPNLDTTSSGSPMLVGFPHDIPLVSRWFAHQTPVKSLRKWTPIEGCGLKVAPFCQLMGWFVPPLGDVFLWLI
jgi:hypothetical protein